MSHLWTLQRWMLEADTRSLRRDMVLAKRHRPSASPMARALAVWAQMAAREAGVAW